MVIKKLLLTTVVAAACLAGRDARASTLTIETGASPVFVGQHGFVFLSISGLGDPGFADLGAFDLNLVFDPTLLRPNRVTFFDALGDPDVSTYLYNAGFYDPLVAGSGQAVTTAFAVGAGGVDVAEVSLLQDRACVGCPGPFLEDLQSSPFLIVGFIFDAIGEGTSPLTVLNNGLADGNGNSLSLSAAPAPSALTVHPIPEPSALLLAAAGLPWILARARQVRRGRSEHRITHGG